MIENFNETKKYMLILNEINGDEKSITGIQKSLEDKGINIHRLVLTGYLNAMVELGILKEKEIKPARIFSCSNEEKKDIYSIVGSSMRKMDEPSADYNSLIVLYHLFERPIFTREIEKCGVSVPSKNVRIINSQFRNDYIKKLAELNIRIPQTSQLIEPVDIEKSLVNRLLDYIIYSEYDLRKYTITNTNQKTLD